MSLVHFCKDYLDVMGSRAVLIKIITDLRVQFCQFLSRPIHSTGL